MLISKVGTRETNIFAAENGWLEYDPFRLGPGLFSGACAVSFRPRYPPQKWPNFRKPLMFEERIESGQAYTLHETNSIFAPENRPGPKRKGIVFQPQCFRCELLISGRGNWSLHFWIPKMKEWAKVLGGLTWSYLIHGCNPRMFSITNHDKKSGTVAENL